MAKHEACTRWHWLPWRLWGCPNCTWLWRQQYRRWGEAHSS